MKRIFIGFILCFAGLALMRFDVRLIGIITFIVGLSIAIRNYSNH